jgi:hypothetical protein
MLNSIVSRNIGVDFWYVGMGGASLVDYYLKYCIKGRDSKITLSRKLSFSPKIQPIQKSNLTLPPTSLQYEMMPSVDDYW